MHARTNTLANACSTQSVEEEKQTCLIDVHMHDKRLTHIRISVCVCNDVCAQLKSGARQPTSGIQDAHVQMEHVAKPVLDYMFDGQVEEGESKGLLVAVSFDSDISDGVVRSDVDDTLVPSRIALFGGEPYFCRAVSHEKLFQGVYTLF